eukprot:1426329-Alexandrium_andersonii.AAC.1
MAERAPHFQPIALTWQRRRRSQRPRFNTQPLLAIGHGGLSDNAVGGVSRLRLPSGETLSGHVGATRARQDMSSDSRIVGLLK